jgi:hypothetical protein
MGALDLLIIVSGCAGAGAAAMWWFTRRARRPSPGSVTTEAITEHVRAVGRLVGLEVCAKEIATATRGWAWLPPLLLSQARLAMIFSFEKQYAIDLARLSRRDVVPTGPGKYRLTLPPVQGLLRLIDVTPYDIQDGRVLGLLDVIQMTAARQKELMTQAQSQAAELYAASETRYLAEARRSIERQIGTLFGLFGLEVDVEWAGAARDDHPTQVRPVGQVVRPLALAG